jgi:hypothetical protein
MLQDVVAADNPTKARFSECFDDTLTTNGGQPGGSHALSGHGYPTNLRLCVSGNGNAIRFKILKYGADRLPGIFEGFVFGIAFGDHLWKGGNKHRKSPFGLWLQDDREAELFSHYVAPALRA